jgi:hypothetical protein
MQGVADYTVLLDHQLETPSGFNSPLSVGLPTNAVLNVHSVLAFTLHVRVISGAANLKISANGIGFAEYNLPDGYFGCFVKVVPANVLKHGTNKFMFNLDCSDTDGCDVSMTDVVLWWFKSSTA